MLRAFGPERALPTSRTPYAAGWLPLDLASVSPSEICSLLDPHSLDAIYCIGGMTDVEACEEQPDLAHRVNSRGPAALAAYAHTLQIPFVYLSTEYIFDGHSGPYQEDDEPNPINVYGRSKLAGERAVLNSHPTALVLRTTVVYGPDPRRRNFLYSLLSALRAERTFRVPADQISTPTYNQDLARVAGELVGRRAEGVLHVCGPELLSRYDFAHAAASALGLDVRLLEAVSTARLGQRAARPLSAGLLTCRLQRLFPVSRMLRLEQALADCTSELRNDALPLDPPRPQPDLLHHRG